MDCMYVRQVSEELRPILIPLVTSVLSFFIGAKFAQLSSFVRKCFGMKKKPPLDLEKVAIEMKAIVIQVSQDWIEMTKLISQIQDGQNNFAEHLQNVFETEKETLSQKISASLEEEFLRNDGRLANMRENMETMQDNVASMKTFLQTIDQKLESGKTDEQTVKKLIDAFSQSEREAKRKLGKEGLNKSEREASKLVTSVKNCIRDLMKDVKLNLSIDREEETRELQIILTKLHEDREDIKNTILQAFSIAAEQAKKNFEKFGDVGQDAMQYLAVLNANTNRLLNAKLEDMDTRFKDISHAVNRQIMSIDTVTETLKCIEDQFDGVLQRVELRILHSKKSIEQFEEITQSLERTSNNSSGIVSEVKSLANLLVGDSKKVKDMLREMKIVVDSMKKREADNRPDNRKNEIMQFNSMNNFPVQDISLEMVRSWDRMTDMTNTAENGCQSICKLIDGLEQKLRSLNASLAKLDDVVQNVNPDQLTNQAPGGSGDFASHALRKFKNKLGTGASTPKLQNTISVDKEVNLVDIILHRVLEKRNLNSEKEELPILSQQDGVSDVGLAAEPVHVEPFEHEENENKAEKKSRDRKPMKILNDE